MRARLALLCVGLMAAGLAAAGARAPARAAARAAGPVAMIELEGAIDVPSAEYLDRAIGQARDQGAECLLIVLNTPGGLGEAMMRMSKALLNAPVPTIVYVSPGGAFAMSAGTFVTLAANIAAMHPATTIGAAHPVELISIPQPEEEQGGKKGEKATGGQGAVSQKVVNAFAQQARVIAEERGRNADWAEKAVRESATLSARDALRQGVIDVVAEDVRDLLKQVDGREVSLPSKRKVRLETAGAQVVELPPSAKEKFLHVLGNPNLLLVLLVLAGMGIMFELQNPGAILPGVIGGLCLLLALYSMAVLPVNYAAVGLIVFSMLLFLAEVKVASHGILTVGGVISFVLGALMLTGPTAPPWVRVSWQVVAVMAALILLFFAFVIGAAVRAHMRRVGTGEEDLLTQRGRALSALSPGGEVFVEGERWRARAVEGEIGQGEAVEVVGQEGLTLLVRRARGAAPEGTGV